MPTNRQGSIAVPIAVVVFAMVMTIVVVRVETVVSKLHKTDTIACSFIQSDANTRRKQASNATKSTVAQRAEVRSLSRLINLIHKSGRGQTAAQRAATATFLGYLEHDRSVLEVVVSNTVKNIVLTRDLAAKAGLLSTELACTPSKGTL